MLFRSYELRSSAAAACGSPESEELVGRWGLLPPVLLLFPIAGSERIRPGEKKGFFHWIWRNRQQIGKSRDASAARTDQTGEH